MIELKQVFTHCEIYRECNTNRSKEIMKNFLHWKFKANEFNEKVYLHQKRVLWAQRAARLMPNLRQHRKWRYTVKNKEVKWGTSIMVLCFALVLSFKKEKNAEILRELAKLEITKKNYVILPEDQTRDFKA